MPSFTVGLDLGQAQDYSALVVVERVLVLPNGVSLAAYFGSSSVAASVSLVEEFHVRAIRRWPLGTTYPAVVGDVCGVMGAAPLGENGVLFVDRSGVGRAVTDLLHAARRDSPSWVLPLLPVTITGGEKANGFNVPKRDLIDGLLVPMVQGRVRVASNLPLGDTLKAELQAFQQKISDAGKTTYVYERRSDEGHGDIAMALMLAMHRRNTLRRPEIVEFPDLNGEEK